MKSDSVLRKNKQKEEKNPKDLIVLNRGAGKQELLEM